MINWPSRTLRDEQAHPSTLIPLVARVRTPVRRAGSGHYMLLTVLSFGATVILTRLYLAMTGYPQLGGGEFHIAHMLWGGLLLFIATLLPLLLTNRWAFVASALLGGSGMGLFIDEVGKFITYNNNYFHPLAAPIIYAVFLLTVLVYIEARRPPPPRARDDLYRVFETLGEVLDCDLDRQEQAALLARLQTLARQTERPDLAPLATALLTFVTNDQQVKPPPPPTWGQRLNTRLSTWEDRWLGRRLVKGIILAGLLGVAGWAFIQNQIIHVAVTTSVQQGFNPLTITTAEISAAGGGVWFVLRVGLVASIGLLLMVASGLLALGRDRYGVAVGQWGLLLALTAGNLFVFYFDQFGTVGTVLVQYILLLAVLYYRRRFVLLPSRAESRVGDA